MEAEAVSPRVDSRKREGGEFSEEKRRGEGRGVSLPFGLPSRCQHV